MRTAESGRTSSSGDLGERYRTGLRDYLTGPSEAGLELAYFLGRLGIADGLGVLEIALVQREALRQALAGADSAHVSREMQLRADEYLSECLAPFEIVHRGYRESIGELRRLNQELERRAAELTSANLLIERMSRARWEFLADASRRLAATLDYDSTLSVVAELPVPELADWCVVELLESDATIRRATMAHASSELRARADALATRPAALDPAQDGVARVIRTRTAALLSGIDDERLAEIAPDSEHQLFFRALGCRSMMIVPLEARSNVLGAITLGSGDSERFAEADLLLAEELGRRASIALDNARLYREAQNAVETRDRFLSVASHELKTPLTPLMLKLEIAARRIRRGTQVELSTLETAIRQVERLRDLVNELLDVTRIQTGKLELDIRPLSLASIVRELVSSFQAAMPGRPIAIQIEDEARVDGDRSRLEQVITNVLDNALKYSREDTPVEVFLGTQGGEAILSVRDYGIGIPRSQQDRLFTRFFRADNASELASGLGLGLYICRDIVRRHAGRIWVESDAGKGATFFVALPLDSSSESAAEPAHSANGDRDG